MVNMTNLMFCFTFYEKPRYSNFIAFRALWLCYCPWKSFVLISMEGFSSCVRWHPFYSYVTVTSLQKMRLEFCNMHNWKNVGDVNISLKVNDFCFHQQRAWIITFASKGSVLRWDSALGTVCDRWQRLLGVYSITHPYLLLFFK